MNAVQLVATRVFKRSEGSVLARALASTSGATATFSRASVAYKKDGSLVASGVPRYETGKFGQAIMLEEPTTNLALRSEELNTAPWAAAGTATITPNDAMAPNDTLTADKITSSSATGDQGRKQDVGFAPLAATKYALSAFGKPGTNTKLRLGFSDGLSFRLVDFNLTNGTVIGSAGGSLAFTASMELTDEGYYRCGAVFTTGAAPTIGANYSVMTANEIGSLWPWGVQFERKDYVTSYVKTEGATATRAAEQLTVPTAGVLSPTEGQIDIPVEVTAVSRDTGASRRIVNIDRSIGGGGFLAFHSGTNTTFRTTDDTGAQTDVVVADADVPLGWRLFSFRWGPTGTAIFVDGVKRAEFVGAPKRPSGFAATMNIGSVGTASYSNTLFDDLRISNMARSDSEITAYELTQPSPADDYTTWKQLFDSNLDALANWIEGTAVFVEAATHFSPDGGSARFKKGSSFEVFDYTSTWINPGSGPDKLVGVTRPNTMLAWATGTTFVEVEGGESDKFVDGYVDGSEQVAVGVPIAKTVSRFFKKGARDEDDYDVCWATLGQDGAIEEVVSAPLNKTPTLYADEGAARMEYREDGLYGYDAAGNQTFIFDPATGNITAVGIYKNALTGTRIEIHNAVLNEIRSYDISNSIIARLVLSGNLVSLYQGDGVYGIQISGLGDLIFLTEEIVLAAGKQARGQCGVAANVGAAGQRRGHGVTYGGVSRTTNVPIGVTFTPVGTDSNVATFDAIDITNRGFLCRAEALASGEIKASRTYVTTGA